MIRNIKIKVFIPKTKDFIVGKIPIEFQHLIKIRWVIDKDGYATYGSKKLHQEILGKKTGLEIDHINRNKLDNSFSNLRHVTHQQNCMNRLSGKPNWSKEKNKWRIRTTYKNKEYFGGYYNSYEEAVKARNKFIISIIG